MRLSCCGLYIQHYVTQRHLLTHRETQVTAILLFQLEGQFHISNDIQWCRIQTCIHGTVQADSEIAVENLRRGIQTPDAINNAMYFDIDSARDIPVNTWLGNTV